MGMAQHDLTPTIDKTCQFCIAHRPLEIFITGLSPKNFPGCHEARFGHSGAAPVVLLPAIFQEQLSPGIFSLKNNTAAWLQSGD